MFRNGMVSRIIGIIIGIVFIVGGLSGTLVFRGTNSSVAVVVVGAVLLIWNTILLIRHFKAPKSTDDSLLDGPSSIEKEINGIKIKYDKSRMNDEMLALGENIAKIYRDRFADIAEYLSRDDGMKAIYGNLTKDELIAGLNEPDIYITGNGGQLSYCNHVFDNVHIIGLEFSGVLESFSNVQIDG